MGKHGKIDTSNRICKTKEEESGKQTWLQIGHSAKHTEKDNCQYL